MSDLEQAKRRNRKVYITDIAIEKVPYIEYHGYNKDKCKIMQELAFLIYHQIRQLWSNTYQHYLS